MKQLSNGDRIVIGNMADSLERIAEKRDPRRTRSCDITRRIDAALAALRFAVSLAQEQKAN